MNNTKNARSSWRSVFRKGFGDRHAIRCLAVGLLLVIGSPVRSQQATDPVTVIISLAAPPETLSANALRAMFTMRLRSWQDGQPVRVFVLKDNNPLHVAFCKQILNVYPHQLRTAWDRQVFSGTGQAPIELESVEQMRERVATTPGAIGYLLRSEVNDKVRALQIP